MLSSQIPSKFPIPFANGAAAGSIRQIPAQSQDQTNPSTRGAASLTDGFPVPTGQSLASGGVPPAMQDFNGILYQTTGWARWQAAAGLVPYDPAFSVQIGGYPSGATVTSATTPGRVWVSIADNNTTNPDASTATNWLPLMLISDVLPYTPAGATYLRAFTPSNAFNDFPGGATDVYSGPFFTIQSLTIPTGNHYAVIKGTAGFRNTGSGADCRIRIRTTVQGGSPVLSQDYCGIRTGSNIQPTANIEADLTGLDPTKSIFVELVADKNETNAPTVVFDPRLNVQCG